MTAVLVLAKAPVPGEAKTRLAAAVGDAVAADLAAAALLDTLRAASGTGATTLVALTGDLARAARRAQVQAALVDAVVFDQRGDGLG
ncbi:MAG: glycosyltransferase, partial [Nocardioidaceae bacterium]|nr:glycosyltransferase [Nocardioidaceae bacterium]